jgi:hypothetical protein
VLVTGGVTGGANNSTAEVYDPATGTWSAAGSMATGRSEHTLTRLPNGKVLAVGGSSGSGAYNSTDLYTP